LSDLPLVGRLFAHNRRETQETDIVLTLTPHIVRVLDISEEDLRPFRLGRDSGGGGLPDLPSIQLPPRDRDDLLSPPSPTTAPQTPTIPFPQPLQGTLPGTPTTPPKKPGGGGENRIPNP
jgi:general secretion pathway protein D